jgi:phosphonate transport system ATP-binding protein
MISVRDVEVVYPNGSRALTRTTLEFERGTFTVLLGSSGAGKSTLLRSMNGLVRPTTGRVEMANGGSTASRRDLRVLRRKTAMVFQQHHLIGRLSAVDNVLVGRLGFHHPLRTLLALSTQERVVALQTLDRVDLLAYANRRADQLSGGQQQRVGIARALVQKPQTILADEPVASLDPATAVQVLGLLHSICKADGLTAIVSLHQVDLARRFADRIVALARGQVVFDGRPGSLTDEIAAGVYDRRKNSTSPDQFNNEGMGEIHEPQTVAA